ncbi:M56 family metallopeptidase [Burkholderiaceae bacterium UC74_6]
MTNTLAMLTLQFSGILLGVLTLRPLLRRAFGAACAYAGWLLVPLLMLVAQAPASRPGLALHQLVQAEVPAASTIALPAEVEGTSAPLLLWGAGVIVVLALLVLQQLRYRRTLGWDAAHQHWRGPIGSGPGLMGLFPPRLVLPADFESRFTPAQQQLILAHEAVHRARGDNFWNLLAVLCCAVQWFNPLAWVALRAQRIDQELACDAAVLSRSPQQHADYAHALISAQGLASHGPLWSSWRSRHPLVERVAMLKSHALARRRSGLAVLSLAALLGAGTVHALQSSEVAKPAVRLVMHVQFVQSALVDVYNQTVDLAKGQAHVVKLSGDGEFDVTAQPSDKCESCWDLRMHLRQGDYKTAPRLITKAGEKASLKMSDKKGVELTIEMTPTPL